MPAAQAIIRRNFVVEILTPTPRRWTPYRGTNASGQRGLTVNSNFYSTQHIEIPQFTEEDSPAPPSIQLKIGNAQNIATDLVSNTANRRATVTITEVQFDVDFNITSTSTWFIGKTGAPSFEGEIVNLECHADVGRLGPSPSKQSKTLMTAHTPPTEGSQSAWFKM
jgi:hypothetical protein